MPIDMKNLTDKRPMSVSQMFPHQWLSIPREIREKMAEIFDIQRSSYAEVHGNQLVSDGRTVKDLSVVNIDSLQKFTETKSKNFLDLLEKTINKIANGQ